MKQMGRLNREQQTLLLGAARAAIARVLGMSAEQAEPDAALLAPGAAFVTLTQKGRLRGCIGHLQAVEPLWESVCNNAVAAALHDPRFAPLAADELARTHIEISVLSAPEPFSYRDTADLLARLQAVQPGLILEKAGHRATFLPQVWEQLPKAPDFLSALCHKAGLAPKAWQEPGIRYQCYGVQCFEEN